MLRSDDTAIHAIGSGPRPPARAVAIDDAQRGMPSPAPVVSSIGGLLPSARIASVPRVTPDSGPPVREYRIHAPSGEYSGAITPAAVTSSRTGPTAAVFASHDRTWSAVPTELRVAGSITT